jgi:hypothetical protein
MHCLNTWLLARNKFDFLARSKQLDLWVFGAHTATQSKNKLKKIYEMYV